MASMCDGSFRMLPGLIREGSRFFGPVGVPKSVTLGELKKTRSATCALPVDCPDDEDIPEMAESFRSSCLLLDGLMSSSSRRRFSSIIRCFRSSRQTSRSECQRSRSRSWLSMARLYRSRQNCREDRSLVDLGDRLPLEMFESDADCLTRRLPGGAPTIVVVFGCARNGIVVA